MVARLVGLLALAAWFATAGCGDNGDGDGGSNDATVKPPDGAGGSAGEDEDEPDGAGSGAGSAEPRAGRGADSGAGPGSSDGGAADPDAAEEPFVPVPIAELPAAFADAICDALLQCVGESALRQLTAREDCAARVAAELEATEFHHMDEAIASGHVLYDAAQLPACLVGVRELGCDVLTDSFPQPCVDVLAGNVAEEGECTISAECEGTAFCAGAATGMCPSTCTPLLAQGAACSADNECGDGLLCPGGTCEAPSRSGQPCGGNSGRTCALGFNCMGSTDVDVGECVENATVQVGEEDDACEPGGTLCREGLSCVFASGDAFHCQPQVGAGEPCHLGLPGQCPLDEYCDAASVMQEGTCLPLPSDAEPCVLGDVCAPSFVCVPEVLGALCRPIRDNGGDCSVPQACRSGRCEAGKCAPPPACD